MGMETRTRHRVCTTPQCQNLADQGIVCSACLHSDRRKAGLCANCGSPRDRIPVINELTERQRLRYGKRVWYMRCTGCGRTQRPYAE